MMKPLNIADNTAIAGSPDRLRSDLGSTAVDYAAAEQAVRWGHAARAAAVSRFFARLVAPRRSHDVSAEGIGHAADVARDRDASFLRRAARRMISFGTDAAMPARRADGDGFGVMLGGMATTITGAANDSDRRRAA